MTGQIDPNDSRYGEAAQRILQRYEANQPEANITSAIRDFLILTGLARSEQIVEENPPSYDGSRRAVDLTALDTFIEVKRRIGTVGGFQPNPQYIEQIDDYLAESVSTSRGVRTGILTDGRYWLLRWPNAGAVKTARPYGFELRDSESWLPLFEWLRDTALTSLDNIYPDRDTVERYLGPNSPSYQRDISVLGKLFEEFRDEPTILVKRRLWNDLLRAALRRGSAYASADG